MELQSEFGRNGKDLGATTPQLLASAFRGSPDIMFVVAAATGAIVDLNDAACAAVGNARNELVGRHLGALPLWADSDAVGRVILQLARRRVARGVEVQLVRADRTRRAHVPSLLSGRRLSGDSASYLVCCRDIERRRHRLRRGARQHLEELGRLSGGVAHDLNNLLTIIGSYAGMLRLAMESGQAPRIDDVAEIELATSRGRELARRVVAFGRNLPIQRRLIDPNEAIARAEGMLRPLLGGAIALELRLAQGLPRILADPVQLDQILLNLTVNAADAMPHGGALAIATSALRVGEEGPAESEVPPLPAGQYVALEVADTGHGMDDATLERIFEPYFTTKGEERGTGLGLAIVAGIARQAGGAVHARSAVGAGTRIAVYWPASRPEPPAQDDIDSKARRQCVLVVDEDASVRRVIRRWLREAGYDSAEAPNGQEALARLTVAWPGGRGPSIVLADVGTSTGEGAEFGRTLFERRPDLPLILMSAYADVRQSDLAPPSVVTRVLQKPFTPHELTMLLAEAISAWETLGIRT